MTSFQKAGFLPLLLRISVFRLSRIDRCDSRKKLFIPLPPFPLFPQLTFVVCSEALRTCCAVSPFHSTLFETVNGKSNDHGETWVCESRVSFALSPLLEAAKRTRLPASDPLI
jgi:hypothetical protein